jgi:hypothetical protein
MQMSGLLCKLGLHRWSRWSEPRRRRATNMTYQFQKCELCEKVRTRKVIE